MDSVLEFTETLALRVGELLLEHFTPSGIPAQTKGDTSVVTQADLAADRFIRATLQERFQEDALLSEELSATFWPGPGQTWVIDPLDGTTNFSLGLPFWGVSITRVDDQGPELAVLNFPLTGELYRAQRGGGAFLNGIQIRVKPFQRGQPAAFFSCCSRTHRRYEVRVPYKTRILGSAVYSFCSVARGSAILAFEATPKIWDVAGGWLLVQEAGGVVETYNRQKPFPLESGKDYSRMDVPILAAATKEELNQARARITPIKQLRRP